MSSDNVRASRDSLANSSQRVHQPKMKEDLDFLVIGATKAGTTSLFEYLRRHPGIAIPSDKEAPYFSRDTTFARGWESYLQRNFASAEPNQAWGTVTPDYMAGSVFERARTPVTAGEGYGEVTIPMRIHERLPSVRIVALLRDPVARARSHHLMETMNGRETRAFADAIDEQLQPKSLESARARPTYTNSYIAWGEYARILDPYFALFPRDQILVVFTQELEATPGVVLRRVYEFIGAAPEFVPDNLGKRYRVGASTRRFSRLTPEGLQRALSSNSMSRSAWHALPTGARGRVDREFRRLAYRFDLWNRRSIGLNGQATCAEARVRGHFDEERKRLSELGIFPPWTMAEADSG